jgi:hypothetical protein
MATETGSAKLDRLFAFLEHYGKVATFLTGILLTLSVFYDYNFLSALRLSFADVPTPLTDHVRTAILWLPSTMLAVFGTLLLTLLLRVFSGEWLIFGLGAIPKIKDEETETLNSVRSDSQATPWRPWVRKYVILAGILVTSFIVLVILGVTEWDVVYGFFMPIWFYFSFRLLRRLKPIISEVGIGEFGMALFVVIPIVFAFVGRTGYADGRNMRRTHMWDLGREVLIKTETATEFCKVLGVRRFSTAAILVDQNSNVTVLPAERLLEVRPKYNVKFDGEAPACPKKTQG